MTEYRHSIKDVSALILLCSFMTACDEKPVSGVCIPNEYKIGNEWLLWESEAGNTSAAFRGCEGRVLCELPEQLISGHLLSGSSPSWMYEDMPQDAKNRMVADGDGVVSRQRIGDLVVLGTNSNITNLYVWEVASNDKITTRVATGDQLLVTCSPEEAGERICTRNLNSRGYRILYTFRWNGREDIAPFEHDAQVLAVLAKWQCQ